MIKPLQILCQLMQEVLNHQQIFSQTELWLNKTRSRVTANDLLPEQPWTYQDMLDGSRRDLLSCLAVAQQFLIQPLGIDLGAGLGTACYLLNQYFKIPILGIEINPAFVISANQTAAEMGVQVNLLQGNIFPIDFEPVNPAVKYGKYLQTFKHNPWEKIETANIGLVYFYQYIDNTPDILRLISTLCLPNTIVVVNGQSYDDLAGTMGVELSRLFNFQHSEFACSVLTLK